MIIDIHTHAFPDELAARAVEVLAERSGITPYTDGPWRGCDSMRRAGVGYSVVMPIATKPAQVSGINRWAADICRRGEGVIGFGTLHPTDENWRKEIDFLVESGIAGVKFHPDYQQFFVDEPELTAMYRALAEASLIVLFHAGVDIGLPPPVHCTPPRLARVLDLAPDLTVIAAHMGGTQVGTMWSAASWVAISTSTPPIRSLNWDPSE